MTGFNHGMTGAVLALTIKQPALAIPLSFISHFTQDAIPHFGLPDDQLFKRKFNIILISDFVFSIFLMVVLALMFPSQKWLIWACMIAAAGPDLMWAYYRLYLEHIKKRTPHYDPLAKLHSLMQWSQTMPGAFVEGGWFMAMGCIILSLR
jgi:hypothetical protein